MLDPLEHLLMVLCGVSIGGFTRSVFCDIVARELGTPWLWRELVTAGFFAWGVLSAWPRRRSASITSILSRSPSACAGQSAACGPLYSIPLTLVAAASAFGWMLAYLRGPNIVSGWIELIAGHDGRIIMFLLVLLFILIGDFLDAVPAIFKSPSGSGYICPK